MIEKFLIKSIAYIVAYAIYFKRQVVYYWKYVSTGQLTESILLSIKRHRRILTEKNIDQAMKTLEHIGISENKPPPPAMPPVITSRQLEDYVCPVETGTIKGNHIANLSNNGIRIQSFREIAKTSEWKKPKSQTLKVRSGEYDILEYYCKHCKKWVKIHEWETKQNKKSIGHKCKCGKTTYVYD